jgi:hypothetical protein
VNDTCGHAAGDLLLKRASEVLLSTLKSSDLLARLGGVGMYGIVAGHEVIGVPGRGAEHEAGIGERFERDRLIALLEHREFAGRNLLRRRDDPLMRRDPGDVVSLGRVEGPALAGLEAHVRGEPTMLFTPSYSPAITRAGPAKPKSEAPRYWLCGSANSSSGGIATQS